MTRMYRRDRLNLIVETLIRRNLLYDGPFTGAEIGVWKGELSEHLLSKFPSLTLHMVDPYLPYAGSKVGRNEDVLLAAKREAQGRTERFADRVHPWYAKSVNAAKFVGDGFLDFCFIDDDHTYEGCSASLRAWIGKVRQGGLFFGHDYKDREGFGVKKVLWDFTKRRFPVGVNVTDARIEGVWWFVKERGRIL